MIEPLSINHDLNMTQNGHICAICYRPEVDCDVISSQNAKSIEDYVAVNFEVASSKTFRDIKKTLCDGSDIKRMRFTFFLYKKNQRNKARMFNNRTNQPESMSYGQTSNRQQSVEYISEGPEVTSSK